MFRSLTEETLDLCDDDILSTSIFEEIVGSSEAICRVTAQVMRVAPSDATVLITGESGTGKELIARAIHKRSRRSRSAFTKMNCAVTPSSLMAAELFGYEKGAFTGANQRHAGASKSRTTGRFFSTRSVICPAETQVALLRVLQEHEFERVGGTESIPVDVRVIAATNCDLRAAVRSGKFRLDLFYRLNVFPINVPPLRDRPEDIANDDPAVREALSSLLRASGKNVRLFTSGAEFLSFERDDTPACLILDLQMPGLNGLAVQRLVSTTLLIIFISGRGDIDSTVKAMKGGASDFLTKPVDEALLLTAVEQALYQHRIARRDALHHADLLARYRSLTPREQEVLPLLVKGKQNKQIAAELGITEYTVQIHRGNIMRKVKADSFATLVRMAETLKPESVRTASQEVMGRATEYTHRQQTLPINHLSFDKNDGVASRYTCEDSMKTIRIR